MVAPKNIIKKVQIGVNTPSLAHGMQLKDGLGDFFKEEILPEMDSYFNSLQKNNPKIIRIENISLEISIKGKDSLKDIKILIINELKRTINKENILSPEWNDFKTTSPAQNEAEAFLHFLKTGTLPWWFEQKPNIWEGFFEETISKSETLKALKNLLSKATIRKRLIYQFDDNQLFKIVNSSIEKTELGDWQNKIPKKFRTQFWEAVLLYSIYKSEKEIEKIFQNIPHKEVSKLLQISKESFGLNISLNTINLQNETSETEVSLKTEKKQKEIDTTTSIEETETDKDGILIQNAGLILLHPFLKMFFEKMDFLTEKNIKPEKIDEAILLLHYLATGKEQPYEYELIFEKFLCNVPLHHPINRHILLTKEQKMACEILLEAVLGHWTALKSNSTAILQNEFLQREGKLTVSAEKQQLYIQRKTQDILLDKLPWNVYLIKIPWKEKILFVDW
jgi:contractile injection system tape measure protein